MIGNIPDINEGYDRASMVLKEQFGEDKSVTAAHTKETIDLKVKEFYNKLATVNYEALRALKTHTKVKGLVLSTFLKYHKLSHIQQGMVRTGNLEGSMCC